MKRERLLWLPVKWIFVAAFCTFAAGFFCGALMRVGKSKREVSP